MVLPGSSRRRAWGSRSSRRRTRRSAPPSAARRRRSLRRSPFPAGGRRPRPARRTCTGPDPRCRTGRSSAGLPPRRRATRTPIPLTFSSPSSLPLPDDPESHVGHTRGFYDLSLLQLYMLRPEVVEQPDPATEQYGHDVHVDLIQQPSLQTLLNEARRANRDVLLARHLPGLVDRALYTVRDEGERGSL